MTTILITSISLIFNLFFSIGSIEKILIAQNLLEKNIFTFGYLWPSLTWGLFTIANSLYLLDLIKRKKKSLNITKKHLLISILLFITPNLIGLAIGKYYTYKAFSKILELSP